MKQEIRYGNVCSRFLLTVFLWTYFWAWRGSYTLNNLLIFMDAEEKITTFLSGFKEVEQNNTTTQS
jgi:hypothetical protein